MPIKKPTPNEKNLDVLAEALRLYENGKSIPEVLRMHPNERDEIREMFQTIVLITKEAESLKPNREGLEKLLKSIYKPITVPAADSFEIYSKPKGQLVSFDARPSSLTAWMGWKIAVPMIAVVLAVGGFWALKPGTTVAPGQSPSIFTQDNAPTIESNQNLSAAKSSTQLSADISPAIDSIVSAADLESAVIQTETTNAAFINASSAILNSFSDNYDNQI